jgi:hypothetical protein
MVFRVASNFQARPVRSTLTRQSLEALEKTKKNSLAKLKGRIVDIADGWRERNL